MERNMVRKMVELIASALDPDAVDSQTFDEVCNRYTVSFRYTTEIGSDEIVWTIVNVARRLRAEAINDDPVSMNWNTPTIRGRMVEALREIAGDEDIYLPPNVVVRIPEAVEQALEWFGTEWAADALLAERPLWHVIKPILFAASFYSELDDGE